MKNKNSLPRKYPVMVRLNDAENKVLKKYMKKYKIKNKSELFRKLVFSRIIEHFEEDYPTIFDKE